MLYDFKGDIEEKFSMEATLAEILGWVGACALILSYTLTNMRLMRIANSVGCVMLIAYSALLGLPSIVLMNASCLFVHMCYLLLPRKTENAFEHHRKAIFAVFALYCIAFLTFALASGYPWQEMLGVVSSLAFIGGWLLPDERKMRSICASALAVNIAYAVLIGSVQVIVTNSISLIVDVYRLAQSHRQRKGIEPLE